MTLTRLLGKLRPAVIASLYVCSLLFVLPGALHHLGRPAVPLGKSSVAQGAIHFAIADFDGDLQPDTATIRVAKNSSHAAEYFLELQLSSGLRPAIGILGPAGGLQITPQDVNGDKIADLVITSPFDSQFVAILLNDGKGNFKQVAPSDYPDVGKRPGSRLLSHDLSGEFQLTLGEKRSTGGQEATHNSCARPLGNDSQFLGPVAISIRSAQILARAGRAPPLA